MIRLSIALDDSERTEAYGRAVSRLQSTVIVDGVEEADAVIVGDPEQACETARSGRHVLLENVVGAGGPELEKLAAACRTAQRCCMPAHTWRFRPSTRAVHDALVAGKLGQPGLLRIHRWEHRDTTDTPQSATALTAEIDLANWFFGSQPREIYTVARDDFLQVHLGFADGGMALVDSAGLPAGDDYYSLSLIGSTGAAYADAHRDMQLLYDGGAPDAIGPRHDELDILGLLQEFTSAIGEARDPLVTLEATATARVVLQGVTATARESGVARFSGDVYELD